MRRFLITALWLLTALLAAPLALAQTTLIAAGSSWKYLDNGSNAGTAWRAAAFNDSTWAAGAAQLGYGDGDEATVIGYGGSATAKYITSYFRRAFTVADASALGSLQLRLKRDDGAVVYLNGVEIYRSNMPAGTVAYTTLASTAAADDGNTWQVASLASTGLVSGSNVLAVEVHQSAANSSDLSFDLELVGNSGAPSAAITRGPYLQLGTPGSVQIRWRTNIATDSQVRFGASATSLTGTAVDSALTTEHIVNLSGLAADAKYFYSVGSSTAALVGADANHFFVTSPPGGTARPTRIWVIGDAGNGSTGQLAVRNAYEAFTGTRHTDLWLQLGDNAYTNGTDAEYQARMFDVYPSMLRKSVTWPTLGNHDSAQTATPPETLPYFHMFSFPTAAQAGGVASGSKRYYSFDYGNIHFINLDSMASSRAPGSPMLAWLQADLAANTKEWTIAYWHHPPYTKGTHDSDTATESIEMRSNVLPILESYGVDLVLGGHSHVYERSYLLDGHYGPSTSFTAAMKKNAGSGRPAETGAYTKPLGPSPRQGAVYAVAGSSGSLGTGPLNHPAMFISLSQLGSLVLDVNGTRLDATFLSDTGTVRDSFSLIKGSAPANQSPSVALTAPAAGTSFAAGTSIALAASASDADGSIARVDFYAGATLLGSSTAAPYGLNWAGAAAGSHSLSARAFDNLGASTTSASVGISVTAPATSTTLVAKGSVWKYLANGSNAGTAWRASAFDDSAWPSGAAKLGYGDADVVTTLPFGPNSKAKYITTYFRKAFNVTNAAAVTSLTLNLLRDDGAVVYLNGVEVARSNMPTGTISASTLASAAVSGAGETTYYAINLPPSSIVSGSNVLAVEIHQSAANSSDLKFDLELVARP